MVSFTFDPAMKGTSLVLSSENRVMTAVSGHTAGVVLGTASFSEGVHYWEVKVDRGRGGGHLYLGLAVSGVGLNNSLSQSTYSFGWYFDGPSAVPGSLATNPTGRFTYGVGDVVGLLLDLERFQLQMYVNKVYTGHVTIVPNTYFPAFGCYGAQDQFTLLEDAEMPDVIFGR